MNEKDFGKRSKVHEIVESAIIWMCVVLLALRINVSLESRKTQGTLPFSQSISQPFGRLLSQRNIEESGTHCLRPILKL